MELHPAREKPATDEISTRSSGDAESVPVVEAGRMQLISYVRPPIEDTHDSYFVDTLVSGNTVRKGVEV